MRTDIDEMDSITEEVHQILQDAEREIALPREWTIRFGRWDRLKELLDTLIDEYKEATENSKKVKEGMELLCGKMQDIHRELEELPESGHATVDSEINEAWVAMEELVDTAIDDHELDMYTTRDRKKLKKKQKR